MSKQELLNQSEMSEDVNVSKRRRFIMSAAPVVLTLASPVAFGGNEECYSELLSGNLSQTPPTSCNRGQPSSYWTPYLAANWSATSWNNRTTLNSMMGSGGTTFAYNQINPSITDPKGYLVLAMLNAKSVSGYALTIAQVTTLWNGGSPSSLSPVAGYADMKAFLIATWTA